MSECVRAYAYMYMFETTYGGGVDVAGCEVMAMASDQEVLQVHCTVFIAVENAMSMRCGESAGLFEGEGWREFKNRCHIIKSLWG